MTTLNLARYAHNPAGFIDRFIKHDEKGRAFHLAPHQRRVLDRVMLWDENGRLLLKILLWGEMKKSGKTFLAAALVVWWAFTNPNTEVICAANDLDQSVGRVFKTLVSILKQNAALAQSARIRSEDVLFSNGTTVTAIASDYKGAAGSRHSLVVYDELWGFSLERAERLYEELTPPPTEPDAWVLVVTYAGWTGESVLLERLYRRGLAGERIDPELELYRQDDLVMFWSHTPRQPWQTERYYASQREILRPNTFARLHLNHWVSTESAFLTQALWGACVDPNHLPVVFTSGPFRRDSVVVGGVDVSVKNDSTAAVIVQNDGGQIRVLAHKIWQPTANSPMDLEATVEQFIREIHARFLIQAIYYDPFQFHRSATTLQQAGVRMREFPQSVANTVRMGQTLYDLIQRRVLVLYPSEELRQQALNAVAVETPRGFRMAKEKASRKIDAIAALSMACCAALDYPQLPPLQLLGGNVAPRSAVEIEAEHRREEQRRYEEGVGWLNQKLLVGDGVYFPGD